MVQSLHVRQPKQFTLSRPQLTHDAVNIQMGFRIVSESMFDGF